MTNLLWLDELRDITTGEAMPIYGANGWPVLPLHSVAGARCTCGSASCRTPGKHPRTTNGVDDASTDAKQIAEWVRRWPDLNIGFAQGNGRAVLDEDDDEGRLEREALERQHGPFSFGLRGLSGRVAGGVHWHVRVPAELDARKKLGDCKKIDIKHKGGYVVVAPSLHLSGNRYRWLVCVEPPIAPDWMLAAMRKPVVVAQPYVEPRRRSAKDVTQRERQAEARLRALAAKVAGAAEGERNDLLNWAWYRLQEVKGALSKREAIATLRAAAQSAGLEDGEIDKVLRDRAAAR